MKLMAIYGSSRRGGNSEQLTDLIIGNLPATRLYLADTPAPAIDDRRHAPEGFPPITGPYQGMVEQLLAHDLLLFATPLYWYGMSGHMKNFVDNFSHALRDPRYNFREAMKSKEAFVLITGSDQARRKGLPLVQQFGLICDFLGMKYGGYLIAEGGKPGEALQDRQALAEARLLHETLASRLS